MLSPAPPPASRHCRMICLIVSLPYCGRCVVPFPQLNILLAFAIYASLIFEARRGILLAPTKERHALACVLRNTGDFYNLFGNGVRRLPL